jgi:imidazolonepropionase-like amidohydrolase
MILPRKWIASVLVLVLLCTWVGSPAWGQNSFGDLAEGPYDRLVIRGANVIPGHGGPPTGPYDIVIEGNMITEMIPFDPVSAERRDDTDRPDGDRVIDASGKYVMPGMVDLHHHLRQEPLPLKYIYYLKLAHGATTTGPASDRARRRGPRGRVAGDGAGTAE